MEKAGNRSFAIPNLPGMPRPGGCEASGLPPVHLVDFFHLDVFPAGRLYYMKQPIYDDRSEPNE